MGDRHHLKVVRLSRVLGILLFLVSLGYLFMLLSIEIGPGVDAVEIYVRNLSSIIAILIASRFFNALYLSYTTANKYDMKSLRIASIALAVAGIIKVLISLFYLIVCIVNGNIVMWFYVGEIIVWGAIALFAVLYYKKLRK